MAANFCPQCGIALSVRHERGVHQVCDCGHFIGHNPVAVNVVLLPIRRADGTLGLLAGRRGIQPGLGELSLPAGYQDKGEGPPEGAARELLEELGVKINHDDLLFYDIRGNRPNTQVIMCWVAPEMPEEELPSFVENNEVTERLIVDRGEGMAFSSHKRWVERFLSAKPDPGREELTKVTPHQLKPAHTQNQLTNQLTSLLLLSCLPPRFR